MSDVQNKPTVNEFFIPKKLFDIDMTDKKVFESKSGKFTSWNPKDGVPDYETELDAMQFTIAVYARSQEAASNNNLSDKDKEANQYFISQIKETDDPDLFHLMMSDFSQWNELMEEMNYACVTKKQVYSMFERVYEVIQEYNKSKETSEEK